MATPFSMPANIVKGTAVSDGFRIFPKFDTLNVTDQGTTPLLISNSSYNNYGPGMLITPFNTWNITPYPMNNGNIVANTVVTGAQWLTLAGDNGATTIQTSGNAGMFPPGAPNQFYLQFDWPRVPEIQVATADMTGPVAVTFFGFDWYGFPLQHTYTVQNQGRYPGPIYNVAVLNGKAFYKITGVYFNGATTNGATINCQASNTFGLPYVLKSYADVSAFYWNGFDMKTQSGVALMAGGTVTVNTPASVTVNVAINDALNAGNNFQTWSPSISLSTITQTNDAGVLAISANSISTQAAMGSFTILSTVSGDGNRVNWSIIEGGQSIVYPSFETSTATSTDVRGLFELPGLLASGTATTETWQQVPDGDTQAIFTYYCEGFDQWLNILNAGGQPQFNGVPATPPATNNIVPPNLIQNIFGVQQYYTGIPA